MDGHDDGTNAEVFVIYNLRRLEIGCLYCFMEGVFSLAKMHWHWHKSIDIRNLFGTKCLRCVDERKYHPLAKITYFCGNRCKEQITRR